MTIIYAVIVLFLAGLICYLLYAVADLDDRLTRLEKGYRQTLRRQTMELAELERRLNGLTEVVIFNEKADRVTDDALLHEARDEVSVWVVGRDGEWRQKWVKRDEVTQ